METPPDGVYNGPMKHLAAIKNLKICTSALKFERTPRKKNCKNVQQYRRKCGI